MWASAGNRCGQMGIVFGDPRCKALVHKLHSALTGLVHKVRFNSPWSASQHLGEHVQIVVELLVGQAQLGDGAAGVQHGRVIAPAIDFPDRR